MRTKAACRGFTLIELIIVIAMIGILAAIALPQLVDKPRRTAEVALKMNLRTMRETIDQYKGDKGHYPATLDALVDEGYLRSIPTDPITKTTEWDVEYEEIDFENAPAETELPEEGQPGIIDVHSTSEALSLDGTPYSEW
ncbi:MAG TPA: prepilin-type N-terminal cleavage/methylation domain-containing protein [Thermoanaerobaculia bacterium]|nr:prepilin-type N-terminal cleavage/methylation domain-containing protein [Thermoanaerobaculia bacterium]